MSQVRHFPRYSQRENIVTNNTLLLMSRLHDHSRLKFGRFLAALADDDNIAEHLQLRFSQQRPTAESVVDGFIAQSSFKIIVETKLDATDFTADQLRRHTDAFDNENHQVLMLLSPTLPLSELGFQPRHHPHRVLRTTFEEVLSSARACLSDHDEEMLAVVEDFRGFCSEENLLPRDSFQMFAPPCGQSFVYNRMFRLYYCPSDWNRRPSDYLGIYADKAVRLIGKVSKTPVFRDGEPDCELSECELSRVNGAIESALNKLGWDIQSNHRFFLCDEMVETDFRKDSSGGIRGHRYFDLGEVLGLEELPALDVIADRLRTLTWQ